MSESQYCTICSTDDIKSPLHNNTSEHIFNYLIWSWENYRKALVKNRHGVVVDIKPVHQSIEYTVEERKGRHTMKLTPDQFRSLNNKVTFQCSVINNKTSAIYLTSAMILHPYSCFSVFDPEKKMTSGQLLKLLPGNEYTLYVQFDSENKAGIGSYNIPVAFNFQYEEIDVFTIARSLIVSIGNEVDDEDDEDSPFSNLQWPPGIKIVYPTQNLKYYDKYKIPHKYYNCVQYGLQEVYGMTREDLSVLSYLQKEIKPHGPTVESYCIFWHILLWMEEVAQTLMVSKYNMEKVYVKLLDKSKIELEIRGLAEKRPSLVVNDMIDIKIHNNNDKCYRGIIKKVYDKSVEISFLDQEFIDIIASNSMTAVDVRFNLSRLNLERMHQAIDQVVLTNRTKDLFPTFQPPISRRFLPKKFYNPTIDGNEEQRDAVLNIMNNTSGSIPYIVFGPPGTGKTITIVEAILQMKDAKKILVCAPANAACDMLVEKLAEHCEKQELIRVLSDTLDISAIPSRVREYSNYTPDGRNEKVSHEKLSTYKIVVTTLGLIGRYQGNYHPDIVFVDEAAQACEPEVNCALAVLKGHQIVLAGDPKQLGPWSSSKVAAKYGFGKSLLERLMDLEVYKKYSYCITMLKSNFRNHPLILHIPNKLFYEGKLRCNNQDVLRDPLSQILLYSILSRRPIRFTQTGSTSWKAIEYCNVVSEERREGRSPSYYNDKEAETVLDYVRTLVRSLSDLYPPVLQEDIGVLTPYIRQMYRIRELLRRNKFDKVEVGTTESFQGREKRIIIISTVRARNDLLLYDRKYNLGFVRNDKRFNVAITRAKSKLIVIGCAHVLATDTKWMEFIRLSEKMGVCCGAPLTIRTNQVKQEIQQRLHAVKMADPQYQKTNKRR